MVANKRIKISTYIVRNNPQGAKELLAKWKMPVSASDEVNAAGIDTIIRTYPKEGLADIAKNYHPDIALFKTISAINTVPIQPKEIPVTVIEPKAEIIEPIVKTEVKPTIPAVTEKKYSDREKMFFYGAIFSVLFFVVILKS